MIDNWVKEERSKLDQLRGKLNLLESQISELDSEISEKDGVLTDLSKLRVVVQEVAEQTLSNLSYHVSSIVTVALQSLPFPDLIDIEVEFIRARKGVECNLWFVKNGQRYKPIDSSGGGALDVASFALRLTYWSLRKNRPVFILDEPFKFVSADLQSHCAEMVRTLTKKMGIQIIMISHLPNINITADKEYAVTKPGRSSKVKLKE